MPSNYRPKNNFELVDIFNATSFILKNYWHQKHYDLIKKCRTQSLGGHSSVCSNPQCKHVEVSYNSCNSRSCPKCSFLKQQKWILNIAENVFPVRHFHVVFTIPHEFNNLFIYNKSVFLNLLFSSSAQALIKTVKSKWNVKAGYTAISHTWGSSLSIHPHVHMIVPAGGVSLKDGQWVSLRKNFLVHKDALFLLFRKIFMEKIKKLLEDEVLEIPSDMGYLKNNHANMLDFLNKPHSKKWNCFIKKNMKNETAIIKYLGRYTHRIAFSNSRILSVDNSKSTVTFRYKDYKNKNYDASMTLSCREFMRRFFHHIPPKGFVRVRHGGICGNAVKNKYVKLARVFVYGTDETPVDVLKQVYSIQKQIQKIKDSFLFCSKCHSEKVFIVDIPVPHDSS